MEFIRAIPSFIKRVFRAILCFIRKIFGRCVPDVNTVMTDSTVRAAIEDAWNDSNPNAPEVPPNPPPGIKQEQGGWVIYDCCNQTYQIIRVTGGTRDRLPTIVRTRPNVSHPEYLVAWFHTHPNTVAEGYAQGPSPADIQFTHNSARVPGIVRSHDGYHLINLPKSS